MNNKLKFPLFLILVAAIFLIDRYLKILSETIGGCFIFCIKRSVNYGAAFSLFSGLSFTRILLIIVALAVLFFTAFYYFKTRKIDSLHLGLAFLFAGTLGNLFDRIFYGYVIDFITFSFWPSFPAFNIADISNVIGVVILIAGLLKK